MKARARQRMKYRHTEKGKEIERKNQREVEI